MDLMRLNGLIRKAISLVKGVDLTVSDDSFEMALTSIVPGFRVCSAFHCPLYQVPIYRTHQEQLFRQSGVQQD